MANVIVRGFPTNVQLSKIVLVLRTVLRKHRINKFWIRELADIPHLDCKEASIETRDEEEARLMEMTLDNLQFRHQGRAYPLEAYVDRPRRRSPPRRRERSRPYEHERSRSPRYRSESSKLDIEIELLRKQRQVIEEERRLLLERKKLELIKEYGPSATRELERLRSRSRSRERRSPRRETYRRHDDDYDRPRPLRRRPAKPYLVLPKFKGQRSIIVDQMRESINKLVDKELLNVFLNLLHPTIRKRLAVTLEGKPRMSSMDIIALYRKSYPVDQDETLIEKLLLDAKNSHWPADDIGNDDVIKDNEAEEKPDEPKEMTEQTAPTEVSDLTEVFDTDVINDEIKNDYPLSLDATDIELSLNHDDDLEGWNEGETNWTEVEP